MKILLEIVSKPVDLLYKSPKPWLDEVKSQESKVLLGYLCNWGSKPTFCRAITALLKR
jgi:hypothetical protein